MNFYTESLKKAQLQEKKEFALALVPVLVIVTVLFVVQKLLIKMNLSPLPLTLVK